MMDINKLAGLVNDQANSLFPNRGDASMYLKLYGEIAEMIESNGAADEVADVFIMLLDYAHRKNVDISVAILEKMDVNSHRDWVITSAGTYKHV